MSWVGPGEPGLAQAAREKKGAGGREGTEEGQEQGSAGWRGGVTERISADRQTCVLSLLVWHLGCGCDLCCCYCLPQRLWARNQVLLQSALARRHR